MFNLETAISTWRRFAAQSGILSAADVDELESHLRDEIDDLISEGVPPEEAFGRAVRRMGDYGLLEKEYRGVALKKRLREHGILHEITWRMAMLKNYFILALRNVRRHKGYTLITVGGIAAGMACCILIGLFIHDEWTHDRFHEHAGRIYRIVAVEKEPSGALTREAGVPSALGPALAEGLPGIEQFVRVSVNTMRIKRAQQFFEDDVLFADSALLDVFSFPLVAGDPATALDNPDGVVLTESAARRFFGEANALGQTLSIEFLEEIRDYVVTGVARDVPSNSSLQFGLILPLVNVNYNSSAFFRGRILNDWQIPLGNTFVLLSENIQALAVEAGFPDLLAAASAGKLGETQFTLQPLTDIHLDPDVRSVLTAASNPSYSYILAGIALLVLLIACINFVTLSVGRSLSRAKEVGVRKVVGAQRGQLRGQFWGEAVLISLLALLAGIVLARLALPAFNELAGKRLPFNLLQSPEMLFLLAALVLIVGIAAGSYPALVLSRFNPVTVLKGRAGLGRQGRFTRSLIVVQFALSIALVIGTFIMAGQLRYLQNKSLGFNKDQVVVVHNRDTETERGADLYERFRNEASRIPAVQSTSATTFVVGQAGMPVFTPLGDTSEIRVYQHVVDKDFVETMQIELADGRNFSDAGNADGAVLVNEALVRSLGWEEAVGRELPLGSGNFKWLGLHIIGVVKDFHFRSLHHEIEPVVLTPYTSTLRNFLVRIDADNVSGTLASLEAVWHKLAPDQPFDYTFLDTIVEEQYRAEQRWAAIVNYATFLALGIACFGLLALSTLAASRRTKEIGIRKVFGATTMNIVLLLSKDFVRLVLVAFVLSIPLAYFAMNQWLDDFAYRIEIGPGIFILAGALALLIAVASVSYQSIKAATADPVKSLRYE